MGITVHCAVGIIGGSGKIVVAIENTTTWTVDATRAVSPPGTAADLRAVDLTVGGTALVMDIAPPRSVSVNLAAHHPR
jgi:hypothetical protein